MHARVASRRDSNIMMSEGCTHHNQDMITRHPVVEGLVKLEIRQDRASQKETFRAQEQDLRQSFPSRSCECIVLLLKSFPFAQRRTFESSGVV